MKIVIIYLLFILLGWPSFSEVESPVEKNQKMIFKVKSEFIKKLKRVLYSNTHIQLNTETQKVLLDILEKIENSSFKLSVDIGNERSKSYNKIHLKLMYNAIERVLKSNHQIFPNRLNIILHMVFQEYSKKYYVIQ